MGNYKYIENGTFSAWLDIFHTYWLERNNDLSNDIAEGFKSLVGNNFDNFAEEYLCAKMRDYMTTPGHKRRYLICNPFLPPIVKVPNAYEANGELYKSRCKMDKINPFEFEINEFIEKYYLQMTKGIESLDSKTIALRFPADDEVYRDMLKNDRTEGREGITQNTLDSFTPMSLPDDIYKTDGDGNDVLDDRFTTDDNDNIKLSGEDFDQVNMVIITPNSEYGIGRRLDKTISIPCFELYSNSDDDIWSKENTEDNNNIWREKLIRFKIEKFYVYYYTPANNMEASLVMDEIGNPSLQITYGSIQALGGEIPSYLK